jgi:hypothetical protein
MEIAFWITLDHFDAGINLVMERVRDKQDLILTSDLSTVEGQFAEHEHASVAILIEDGDAHRIILRPPGAIEVVDRVLQSDSEVLPGIPGQVDRRRGPAKIRPNRALATTAP